jgi:LacI family transcriptional regulator
MRREGVCPAAGVAAVRSPWTIGSRNPRPGIVRTGVCDYDPLSGRNHSMSSTSGKRRKSKLPRSRRKIPTIREIAVKTGLSIATVSYVFSGARRVPEKTAARVRAAAENLGYIPNRIARSLRAPNSRIIGILVPDIRNPFFPAIMDAIKRHIVPRNFEILVGSSEEGIVEQNRILDSFLQYHVAGAIVVSAGSDETAGEELRAFQSRAPIVLVDRDVRGLTCSKVLLRNGLAARQLVGALYQSGHRRIGILAPSAALSIGQERAAGFAKALHDHGLPARPEMVFVGDMFPTSGEMAADYFLRMDEKSRPTAILSCSDVMTIGLLRGLAKLSVRVPRDMSVISFDDTDYFPFMNPPITCIAQPVERFGWHAAELLVAEIEKRTSEPQTIRLNGTLIVRRSVRDIAKHKG